MHRDEQIFGHHSVVLLKDSRGRTEHAQLPELCFDVGVEPSARTREGGKPAHEFLKLRELVGRNHGKGLDGDRDVGGHLVSFRKGVDLRSSNLLPRRFNDE